MSTAGAPPSVARGLPPGERAHVVQRAVANLRDKPPVRMPIVAKSGPRCLAGADCYDGYLTLVPPGADWLNDVPARILFTIMAYRPVTEADKVRAPVLLVDELDRSDEEFEAFLLEVLSELQVTIPELGTIKADPDEPPLVFLTTNGTREMTEALRRRCLHAGHCGAGYR